MDPAAQRDLHDGLWRAHGGFDLVLAPVLLSLVGLWLDSRVGTTPVLTVAFLLFGAVGAALKVFYDWKRRMATATAERDQILAEAEALRARAAGGDG